MKLCSAKTCNRHHDTKYKMCPTCLEIARRSHTKRKRIASEKKVEEGYRLCAHCSHIKPVAEFESKVHRRKKLTSNCTSCREIQKKSEKNPISKRGKCRVFWMQWKNQQKCVDCGLVDERVMEADHVTGKKIHRVSHYNWWGRNGSVEGMMEELKKCEPRCNFCHTIKTKQRSDLKRKIEGRKQQPSIKHRRHEINLVKCNIGECKRCKRKVTMETCCGFDFDHRNEETKVISISQIIQKKEVEYRKHFKEEIPKCDLLCRNCHHIKTHY